MSKNSTNSFISLLIGLIVGGILGILFAPDKGNNTRDRLTFRLNQYRKKLEELKLRNQVPPEHDLSMLTLEKGGTPSC